MRKDDFSSVVKNFALRNANYKCERCWSKRDLEFHHRIPISLGGKSSADNCVVLCHNCHNIAPQDPFLLEKFFLRFASIKELIGYYNASSEDEAIKLFGKEFNLEYNKIKRRIESDPYSHVDTVKQGMKKAVEKRGHSGFNIPYGYTYKDGILEIIPEESKIIKNIYLWYLSGKSFGEIVKMLNSSRIPTKNGGLWAKKTISAILKNPVYCGYHQFEGKLRKGKHSKIIEVKIHQKVQKLIAEKGGRPKFYDFV